MDSGPEICRPPRQRRTCHRGTASPMSGARGCGTSGHVRVSLPSIQDVVFGGEGECWLDTCNREAERQSVGGVGTRLARRKPTQRASIRSPQHRTTRAERKHMPHIFLDAIGDASFRALSPRDAFSARDSSGRNLYPAVGPRRAAAATSHSPGFAWEREVLVLAIPSR